MSSPGKLHLGLTPWRRDPSGSAKSLVEQAELAEQVGFDSFWLPESHFAGAGSIPSPLLELASVAARTSRLRLGTTSFLLPVRHPLLVAEEVAVLDRLSEGRVILGIGRGFRASLFDAFEVDPGEKRRRLEAALERILAAWRGESLVADGTATDDRPVRIAPLPVQRPHPPLWMAAFGEKGLCQAGRLGLPYLASPVETLDQLRENYACHRRALEPSVDHGALAVPVMRTLFVSESRRRIGEVRTALARQAARLATARPARLRQMAEAPVQGWALVGTPDEVERGIERYRQELGMTHLVVRLHVEGVETALLEESLVLLAELGKTLD